MSWLVRSSLPAETLVPQIRRAVQSIDPALPIHDVKVMNEVLHQSMSLERAGSLMTGFFALAALLMATLGVYGVVSYSVRQRTIEIGTRMALGAGRGDVISMVLGGGMKMALYGIAGGAAVLAAAGPPLAGALRIHDVQLQPLVYSTHFAHGLLLPRLAGFDAVTDGGHPR
jgi:putative ABC transport system permease protein